MRMVLYGFEDFGQSNAAVLNTAKAFTAVLDSIFLTQINWINIQFFSNFIDRQFRA